MLLPALGAGARAVGDDVVRRRLVMRVIEGGLACEAAGLPRHEQRIGGLVDLSQAEEIGSDGAIDLGTQRAAVRYA